MRVMILIKADERSEAGVLSDEKLLTDMRKYNEEMVKVGVLIAGEGLHPSSKEKRGVLVGKPADGDRRAIHRGEGAGCRLLALAGEVDGGGHRVGQALPNPIPGTEAEIEGGTRDRSLCRGVHAGAAQAEGLGAHAAKLSHKRSAGDADDPQASHAVLAAARRDQRAGHGASASSVAQQQLPADGFCRPRAFQEQHRRLRAAEKRLNLGVGRQWSR